MKNATFCMILSVILLNAGCSDEIITLPDKISSCGGVMCSDDQTCVDGKCMTTDKTPENRCPDVDCSEGSVCNIQTGSCDIIPDKCADIECPENQTCDENTGFCKDVKIEIPCENIDCPEGSVCNVQTGSCDLMDSQCTGIECPENQICDEETGTCSEETEQDSLCDEVECLENQYCDEETGTCIEAEKCVSVVCKNEEICDPETGECIGSDTPETCSEGEIWDSQMGICVPETLCSQVTCDENEICNESTGKCEKIEVLKVISAIEKTSGVSLKGKKIMFAGNSFIYYGNCVITGGRGKSDKGYFYQLTKANGELATVIDYTWDGHTLQNVYDTYLSKLSKKERESYHYIIMSEAGENNSKLVSVYEKYKKLFPNAKFVYMAHEYTYRKSHSNIINALPKLKEKGVIIVKWGKLVRDIYKGKVTIPNSKIKYTELTFHKKNCGTKKNGKCTNYNGKGAISPGNRGDDHHQNQLSGYITALYAYSAITGNSAQGQPYDFASDNSIHNLFNPVAFNKAHYNYGNNAKSANQNKVFASSLDMLEIQKLIDQYRADSGGPTDNQKPCEHEYTNIVKYLSGSSNTHGAGSADCSLCGKTLSVDLEATDKSRQNIMLIPAEVVKKAGFSTVKEYMLAGKGSVFYQTNEGWGRKGYASIQGMASVCDGIRIAAQKTDGSQLYWKISDVSKQYTASGSLESGGKYISLIGYSFSKSYNVSGFSLFTDSTQASLTGFDILGGKKQSDGSYQWSVLWSGSDISYHTYGTKTRYIASDFETMTIDAIQIGVTKAQSNILYISEFEVYGN